MNNTSKRSRSLTVGGIYEVRGKRGTVVRFKFVHANTGKLTIEVDGVQREEASIYSVIEPDEFEGLYPINVSHTFNVHL